MATALVVSVVNEPPEVSGSGLSVKYNVAFGLDNGSVDLDVVTVIIAAGDTANVINGKMSSAVQNLATSRGHSVARSAITTLPYAKG